MSIIKSKLICKESNQTGFRISLLLQPSATCQAVSVQTPTKWTAHEKTVIVCLVLVFLVFFFTWLDGCFQDSSQCCLWPPQQLAGSWFRGRTRRTHRSRTRTHSPAGKTVYMNRVIKVLIFMLQAVREKAVHTPDATGFKLIMLQCCSALKLSSKQLLDWHGWNVSDSSWALRIFKDRANTQALSAWVLQLNLHTYTHQRLSMVTEVFGCCSRCQADSLSPWTLRTTQRNLIQ